MIFLRLVVQLRSNQLILPWLGSYRYLVVGAVTVLALGPFPRGAGPSRAGLSEVHQDKMHSISASTRLMFSTPVGLLKCIHQSCALCFNLTCALLDSCFVASSWLAPTDSSCTYYCQTIAWRNGSFIDCSIRINICVRCLSSFRLFLLCRCAA